MNTCRRTNLGAKLVRITHPVVWKWLKSGPFGAKIAIFGHKRLQTPQMAGKSGSIGGSQLNTFEGTTLGAKLIRKTHPVVWKWPKSGQFGAKMPFMAIEGSRRPRWLAKVDQMVDHS